MNLPIRSGLVVLAAAVSFAAPATTLAEPGIDPTQLELEPSRNGRFTGSGNATSELGVAPLAPQVQKSFLSVDFDDNAEENDGFRFIPPDAIGAAGKSRVIAVVNTMIEARNKGGHQEWRSSLAEFFAPLQPQTFTFDPKIVYDEHADRFVVITLERVNSGSSFANAGNESRMLLAVSKDGTPVSGTPNDWHFAEIDSKLTNLVGFGLDFWADYPGFEVDEEAIYITANMFVFPGQFGGFGGSFLWIVGKGDGTGGFYDGGPADDNFYDPYGATGGISTTTMPALVHGEGGVGGPDSPIGTFLVSYSGLTFGGVGAPEAAQVITVIDPLGKLGGPFFTQEFVVLGDVEEIGGVCGFPALSDAPQPGTDALIEVNDRRALDAVWRDGKLWMVTTIDGTGSCGIPGTTKAAWIEMDTSGGPGTIAALDLGAIWGWDIADDATTYFPAVAVNRSGVAKFGFSASSPEVYAGAFVTGHTPSDADGLVSNTETVKAGEDYYLRTFGSGRNRWGDYSGIAVDPTNDEFFWVFNEYAKTRSETATGEDGRWGTVWGRTK